MSLEGENQISNFMCISLVREKQFSLKELYILEMQHFRTDGHPQKSMRFVGDIQK